MAVLLEGLLRAGVQTVGAHLAIARTRHWALPLPDLGSANLGQLQSRAETSTRRGARRPRLAEDQAAHRQNQSAFAHQPGR